MVKLRAEVMWAVAGIGMIFVLGGGAATMAAGIPATMAAPLPPPIIPIENILGIKGGSGDILALFATAMQSHSDSDLDALVRAVPTGDPLALRDATIGATSLEPGSETQLAHVPKGWKYGTATQRSTFYMLLWKNAKLSSESAPDAAMSYARAAILLRAMDDFSLGSYILNAFLKDDDGILIAHITDEQRKSLLGVVEKYSTTVGEHHHQCGAAVDRLFLHPQEEQLQTAMAVLNDWFEASPQIAEQLEFARDARALYLHAQTGGNGALAASVGAQIQKWRDSAPTAYWKRWLQEALDAKGMPERVYFRAVWKDGKWVDTNTDDEIP